jgi:hypothetical protein
LLKEISMNIIIKMDAKICLMGLNNKNTRKNHQNTATKAREKLDNRHFLVPINNKIV